MCDFCNGTGSLSKDVDGYLDCVHCDAPAERMALEEWAKDHRGEWSQMGLLWMVHQRALARAADHATT